MPNRDTFQMPIVADLLKHERVGFDRWIDPFARNSTFANERNDLDKSTTANFHEDASEFLLRWKHEEFDGVVFDPPYSFGQAKECYAGNGKEHLIGTVTNNRYWSKLKDGLALLTRMNGKAICFGWNSNGLGRKRGFTLDRVVLIAHGSGINDTIITVETKIHKPNAELFTND